jgi:hypothetical protein
MKRSISSVNNNNRDASSSRPKRIQKITAEQEENNIDTFNDYNDVSSQKKLSKKKSEQIKGTLLDDELNNSNDSGIATCKPSSSSISLSSSSSLKNTPSINHNTKTRNTSQSVQLKHTTNGSTISWTK